jgi:hypothetical protein
MCLVSEFGAVHDLRKSPEGIDMRSKAMIGRSYLICAMAFLLVGIATGIARADDPQNIPDLIRQMNVQARKSWKRDAFLANLLIERDDAGQPFRYDFAFRASTDAKLFHIKQGPSGSETGFKGFTNDPKDLGLIPSRVIDLPTAEALARDHGMKGNLVTAELFEWFPLASQPVIVWRLVPDNDPNVADPNDPNQKNYFIDALTSAIYDPENPDPKDVTRGGAAMGPASAAEMSDFVKSMSQ